MVVPNTDLAEFPAKNKFYFNVKNEDFSFTFFSYFSILFLFLSTFSMFWIKKNTIFCIMLPDIRQIKPDIRPDTGYQKGRISGINPIF